MYYEADILDDLLIKVFTTLLADGQPAEAGRGRNLELLGINLALKNPRARISRSETKGRPFSALGELLWYLDGSNKLEFIQRYIRAYVEEAEADGTLHGAYGPRLFNMRGHNQVANVINALRDRPWTRRAVIQLYSAEDIATRHKEAPCTTAIQFLLRDGKLHCCVTMRSNDAFKGLPHDVFCFTMIQELVARELGAEIGTYMHYAASLHLYEDSINGAEKYLTEGVHSSLAMPLMPEGKQWVHIPAVLAAEQKIREGAGFAAINSSLPPYWQDLLRLLLAFESSEDVATLDRIASEMSSDVYRSYLQRRKAVAKPLPNIAG